MPRDNSKWREAVRQSNNKPASGIPAMGALFGKGHGPGSTKKVPRVTTDTASEMGKMAHTPEAVAKREQRIASLEEIKETLTEIMRDDKAPHMARISAGDKLADRIDGKPVARNINLTVNDLSALSDTDLDVEIARLARADGSPGAGASGEASSGVPKRP